MMKAIIPASTWALEESTELENREVSFPRRRSSEDWLLSVFPAGQAESEGQLVLERVQDSPPPWPLPEVVRKYTCVALILCSGDPGESSLAALQGNGLSVQSSSACAFRVCESLTEQSLPSERFEELLTGPSPGEVMK
uniref:Uncharacterized protein n=1 Tax=Rhinopithecus roxellana TaxID=61622 RepID=A0A2K6R8B1_RHIRO